MLVVPAEASATASTSPRDPDKVSDPQEHSCPLPSLQSERPLRCLVWRVGRKWYDHLQELEKEEQVLLEEGEEGTGQ